MELQKGLCFLCRNTKIIKLTESQEANEIISVLFPKEILDSTEFDKVRSALKLCPICYHKLILLKRTSENIRPVVELDGGSNDSCILCRSKEHLFQINNWPSFNAITADMALSNTNNVMTCSDCLFYLETKNEVKRRLFAQYPLLKTKQVNKNENKQKLKFTAGIKVQTSSLCRKNKRKPLGTKMPLKIGINTSNIKRRGVAFIKIKNLSPLKDNAIYREYGVVKKDSKLLNQIPYVLINKPNLPTTTNIINEPSSSVCSKMIAGVPEKRSGFKNKNNNVSVRNRGRRTNNKSLDIKTDLLPVADIVKHLVVKVSRNIERYIKKYKSDPDIENLIDKFSNLDSLHQADELTPADNSTISIDSQNSFLDDTNSETKNKRKSVSFAEDKNVEIEYYQHESNINLGNSILDDRSEEGIVKKHNKGILKHEETVGKNIDTSQKQDLAGENSESEVQTVTTKDTHIHEQSDISDADSDENLLELKQNKALSGLDNEITSQVIEDVNNLKDESSGDVNLEKQELLSNGNTGFEDISDDDADLNTSIDNPPVSTEEQINYEGDVTNLVEKVIKSGVETGQHHKEKVKKPRPKPLSKKKSSINSEQQVSALSESVKEDKEVETSKPKPLSKKSPLVSSEEQVIRFESAVPEPVETDVKDDVKTDRKSTEKVKKPKPKPLSKKKKKNTFANDFTDDTNRNSAIENKSVTNDDKLEKSNNNCEPVADQAVKDWKIPVRGIAENDEEQNRTIKTQSDDDKRRSKKRRQSTFIEDTDNVNISPCGDLSGSTDEQEKSNDKNMLSNRRQSTFIEDTDNINVSPSGDLLVGSNEELGKSIEQKSSSKKRRQSTFIEDTDNINVSPSGGLLVGSNEVLGKSIEKKSSLKKRRQSTFIEDTDNINIGSFEDLPVDSNAELDKSNENKGSSKKRRQSVDDIDYLNTSPPGDLPEASNDELDKSIHSQSASTELSTNISSEEKAKHKVKKPRPKPLSKKNKTKVVNSKDVLEESVPKNDLIIDRNVNNYDIKEAFIVTQEDFLTGSTQIVNDPMVPCLDVDMERDQQVNECLSDVDISLKENNIPDTHSPHIEEQINSSCLSAEAIAAKNANILQICEEVLNANEADIIRKSNEVISSISDSTKSNTICDTDVTQLVDKYLIDEECGSSFINSREKSDILKEAVREFGSDIKDSDEELTGTNNKIDSLCSNSFNDNDELGISEVDNENINSILSLFPTELPEDRLFDEKDDTKFEIDSDDIPLGTKRKNSDELNISREKKKKKVTFCDDVT